MCKLRIYLKFIFILIFCCQGIVGKVLGQPEKRERKFVEKVEKDITPINDCFKEWKHLGRVSIDSLFVKRDEKVINIFLSPNVIHAPIRNEVIDKLQIKIKERLRRRFKNYHIKFYCKNRLLSDYIPVYYNTDTCDSLRIKTIEKRKPIVTNREEYYFSKGLSNNNIALWASHGYYYEAKLDRWEWQRARLFGTVEDIFPYTITRNFLVPMLEDAGATVFLSRERDVQINEVIIDNNGSSKNSELIVINDDNIWEESKQGFEKRDTIFTGENPFRLGTYLKINVNERGKERLIYLPDIPDDGDYAVYISWGKEENALANVPCEVKYAGGTTRFLLNQKIGYGTWVYLGTFYFKKGKNSDNGCVILKIPKGKKGVVSADAVKFGGGMGNIARQSVGKYIPNKWSVNDDNRIIKGKRTTKINKCEYKISGKPRWMEGARYWFQYAGMPDSLVYNLNNDKNDYNDDYQARGEWVNYLIGEKGNNIHEHKIGLDIPVDLAFAFHTDAGTTLGDSTIGTLGIYSTERGKYLFPDGTSKLASRDLTDIIQTQIVADIRNTFDKDWTRRAMWDKQYSEAWRPKVPVMLLELLSHQNLGDMKYGLDPRFQFLVSRAIYKGMARFLAAREQRDIVIKPLPPDNMNLKIIKDKTIELSWSPVKDFLELSAMPKGYRIYSREEDCGFDNGVYTKDTSMIIDLKNYNTIYSFKVEAVNEGGRSFPGEILSVAVNPDNDKTVLVVNGFNRIAPPYFVDDKQVAGIAYWHDEGVPYMKNMAFTGNQYDYNRSSPWRDDDSPGHGASYADSEGDIIIGNTFDYPVVHGKAIRNAGYSFVSVSDEVFQKKEFDTTNYFAIDLIYGEERGTISAIQLKEKDYRVLKQTMCKKLMDYMDKGGNVFMSGAYVGTDMVENNDSLAIDFASNYLHYRWMTNHADNMGKIVATNIASEMFIDNLEYNVNYDSKIYKVEAPDGIEPVGDNSHRIYRYSGNNVCAGIAYYGDYKNIVIGFPFETIIKKEERDRLMKDILSFFNN